MRLIGCFILFAVLVQPVLAQRKYNKTTHHPLGIFMVEVTGGQFYMGDDTSMADRRPAHLVHLNDFYLSAYEVTQKQWLSVMGSNPASYPCLDCPVNNVSWDDAQEFIHRLNHLKGTHFRLPTEAEWEYAARGGRLETIHNVEDPHAEGKPLAGRRLPQTIAWYERNSDDHVHRVGVKYPNEIGIYDMCGNVEEWCNDFYALTYFSKNPVYNPQGPDGGASHVLRGGSFMSSYPELSVTRRAAAVPNTRSISIGFRLAADKTVK
jgi:formylglycine-generating enzyme required for sulfatase activity